MEVSTIPYQKMERLIYLLIHRFQLRYGGDWNELVSEANEHYTRALTTYDPTRAKLTTHIGYRIWKGLLETARTKGRRANILKQVDSDLDGHCSRCPFDPTLFLSELSEDAALIVSIVWGGEIHRPKSVL